MRNLVTETISTLLQDACYHLPDDMMTALRLAEEREESPAARNVLAKLRENAQAAAEDEVPLCQDTGMAVVFLELGQDVHVIGGDLYEAVQEGVRRAYADGYLRKSIVEKPFSARMNTEGQYAGGDPYRYRTGRKAEDYRPLERVWQREHEPARDADPRQPADRGSSILS